MADQTGQGRVLLVGWDAAEWRVIRPLLADGRMPHLAALLARGAAGTLATGRPLLSATGWATLTTGRPATAHGLFAPAAVAADGSGLEPVGRSACAAPFVWELAAAAGVACRVVNFPATAPSDAVVATPGQIARPDPAGDGWVHLRVTPDRLDPAASAAFAPDRPGDPRLLAAVAATATVHNVATDVIEHDPWRLAAVCYPGLHQLSHAFMPAHAAPRPPQAGTDAAAFGDVVATGYVWHDLMLGRLLDLAGPATTVVLVADHGFGCDAGRPPATDEASMIAWHRPGGLVVVAGPSVAAGGHVAGSQLDVAPTVLALLGVARPAEMPGRPFPVATIGPATTEGVDLPRTAAVEPPRPADESAAVRWLHSLGYRDSPDPHAVAAAAALADRGECHAAVALIDAGRAAWAIAPLRALVDRRPMVTEYAVALAQAYAAAGRTADCRAVTRRLSDRFPDAAEGHAALGLLALAGRRAAAALDHLRAAVAAGRR